VAEVREALIVPSLIRAIQSPVAGERISKIATGAVT
jgi:hypothetical protein